MQIYTVTMNLVRSIMIVLIALTLSAFTSDAYAHSLFNSAESFLGGYRVQVATLPEFPQIDETSQILVRVTDVDFNEVDRFTMGMRFFYNDQQIDAIPPKSFEGGHWNFDYVWKNSGNHIVKIDLYDMNGESGILTYTFNMGTQSPFGYIFIISIAIGAIMFAVVVSYVYLPKRFRSRS